MAEKHAFHLMPRRQPPHVIERSPIKLALDGIASAGVQRKFVVAPYASDVGFSEQIDRLGKVLARLEDVAKREQPVDLLPMAQLDRRLEPFDVLVNIRQESYPHRYLRLFARGNLDSSHLELREPNNRVTGRSAERKFMQSCIQ